MYIVTYQSHSSFIIMQQIIKLLYDYYMCNILSYIYIYLHYIVTMIREWEIIINVDVKCYAHVILFVWKYILLCGSNIIVICLLGNFYLVIDIC